MMCMKRNNSAFLGAVRRIIDSLDSLISCPIYSQKNVGTDQIKVQGINQTDNVIHHLLTLLVPF